MDKVFSKLSFTNLVAGEIELIKRLDIATDEREAHLEILLTLAYHHDYLDIAELKQQYDATMKRVERGAAKWNPMLAERLHQDLTFRASALAHDKEKSNTAKSEAGTSNKTDARTTKQKWDKIPSEIKLHYCMEFNKGSCIQADYHNGKLGNKNVILFHFCCRCLLSDAHLKTSHPEPDVDCLSRA